MIRKTVHYTGHVQGVGFRYTTTTIAGKHDVAGYVQNLADGRVRLVAEGREDEVDALLEGVQSAMSRYIDGRDVEPGDATGEFGDPTKPDTFGVKY